MALSSTRRNKGIWVILIVLLLAIAGGGAGWYFGAGPGSYVSIPSVSGQTPEAAESALKAAGFQVSVESINSTTIPAGQAIDTSPKGGDRVPKGAKLVLEVSLGPKMIAVPTLVGLPQAQAEKQVTDAGFTLEKTKQVFNAKIPMGIVTAALNAEGTPLPAEYPEAGKVQLVVSAGALPAVAGKSQADAFAALTAVGLQPVLGTPVFSSTVPKDAIVSVTVPKAGLSPGDTVTVIPSKGPELIEVPNVVGDLIQSAAAQLKALGFSVNSNAPSVYWGSLRVLSMSKAPGTKIPKGSTITLFNP